MQKIIDFIHSLFNREVDSFVKVLHNAIRRLEAFEEKLDAKITKKAAQLTALETEKAKAVKVGDNLRAIIA